MKQPKPPEDNLRANLDKLATRIVQRLLGTNKIISDEAELDAQIKGLRVAGSYWLLTRKHLDGNAPEKSKSAYEGYRELMNGADATTDQAEDFGGAADRDL